MPNKTYTPKFSYSRLNTYDSCGWKYDLTYNKNHYIFVESVANLFGTLVHWVEEHIADCIKNGTEIPYDKLKADFMDINIPKTSPKDQNGGIYGVNIIKQKFPKEFYKTNDRGESYATKAEYYANLGIYRLEKYMNDNPDLEIYGMEQYFQIEHNGHTLSGYIDRIFHNTKDDTYLIEDIKTKDKPFRDSDLATPLQFIVYTKALSSMLDISTDKIKCAYDLPFCNLKQPIVSPGYFARGEIKLDKIFKGIEDNDYVPNPSPLCAYCPFSATNDGQPEEGKQLCCYYSLWTPNGGHRAWEVAHKWEGLERNDEIMKEFYGDGSTVTDFDF